MKSKLKEDHVSDIRFLGSTVNQDQKWVQSLDFLCHFSNAGGPQEPLIIFDTEIILMNPVFICLFPLFKQTA